MFQAFCHFFHLAFVNLLDFAILVLNDRNVLLLDLGLITELVLVLKCIMYVVILSSCFSLLCVLGSLANLFPHRSVLKSQLLEFLLLTPLIQFMCRQSIDMVSNNLLIENFNLVDLLCKIINLTFVHEVLCSLIFFKCSFFVPQLHDYTFKLGPLGLDCRLKSI